MMDKPQSAACMIQIVKSILGYVGIFALWQFAHQRIADLRYSLLERSITHRAYMEADILAIHTRISSLIRVWAVYEADQVMAQHWSDRHLFDDDMPSETDLHRALFDHFVNELDIHDFREWGVTILHYLIASYRTLYMTKGSFQVIDAYFQEIVQEQEKKNGSI